MAYFDLTLIKKNLEMLPSDTTIDAVLSDFGSESDAYIDALLGNSTPLTTVPTLVRHASSNYAAGSYKKERLKDDAAGDKLQEKAEKQIKQYKIGIGRSMVFG